MAGPVAGHLARARRRGRGAGVPLGEPPALGGREPLIDPKILRNATLRGRLTSFFFQYLLQAGLFFTIPLFLSVALGLSAIATRVRLLPLSVTLLLAAVGVPSCSRMRLRDLWSGSASSRCSPGWVMVAALDAGAGPEIVTWPMLLSGLGVGALASQLGSVTVSSVPDEQSGEVGGLQNTLTNLGRRSAALRAPC